MKKNNIELKILTFIFFHLTQASVTVSPRPISCVAPGISVIVNEGALVVLLALVGGGEHTLLGVHTVGPGTVRAVSVTIGICGTPRNSPVVGQCTAFVGFIVVGERKGTICRFRLCHTYSQHLELFIIEYLAHREQISTKVLFILT